MSLLLEFMKFLIYSLMIVLISKMILIPILRNLAEALNLKSKAIGTLSGIATSMPEFLSVSFSAVKGLIDTSIYNIISSNSINLFLYMLSIILNKNINKLKNSAIKGDIIISIITIIIPLIILKINVELNLSIIPLLLLIFILFYTINKNSHIIYLNKFEKETIEEKKSKKNFFIIIKYIIYLILTAIALFIFGNLLSGVAERLSLIFNVSQSILGITLGLVTSIPEIITFFEAQKYHNKKPEESMEGVIESTNNLLTSNLMNLCIIQSVGILLLSII